MEEKNKQELKEYYKKLIADAVSELKTKGKRHKQIPNILSTIRFFAPLCIVPAAACANMPLTLIFVALFGLTDLVDGAIARKYKLESTLGGDLDAIADKIFASTLLIAAAFIQPALVINFLYELAIGSINFKAKLKKQDPKSNFIGKAKAWFLYPLIGIGFASYNFNMDMLFNIFFVGTTVMQTGTAITYLFKYRQDTKKQEEKLSDSEELPLISTDEEDENESVKKLWKTKNGERIDNLKEMKELLIHENEINNQEKKGLNHNKIKGKKQQ